MSLHRLMPLVLALTLCACDSSPSALPSPDASALSRRPLRLPSPAPTAACPVTPVVTLPTRGMVLGGRPVPDYGYGQGPVYLSGQTQWFRGQVALLLASSSYGGPVLVRGRRIDAQGAFPFTEPAGRMSLDAASQPGRWRMALTSLDPNLAPGCYAVQVDGTTFSEVIVFTVQPGLAPPG